MASGATLPKSGAAGAQATADTGILVVDDIVKQFDTPEGPLIAVDGVSLSVRPGEFLAVIGPSGCGKSTLFNVIGGLIDGYKGAVTVGGEAVRGPHPAIGMLFQEESTFPWRTVIENVAFPLEIAGMSKKARLDKAKRFISLVGLNGFENRYPNELSGGMRQRVAMARALAQDAKVLLMDEPFAALDAITRDVLHEELIQIWDETNLSVLFVTHNVREAVRLAQRVVLLSSRPGRIAQEWAIDLPQPRRIESAGVADLAVEITDKLRGEIRRHVQH